jgi:hypothetical protein
MSEKHPKKIDTSHLQNPEVSHEESDVPIKPLAMFAVYLALAGVVVSVLMYLLFQYFEKRSVSSEGPPSPLAAERQALPPEPRLQLAPSKEDQTQPNLKEHPLEELKTMRAEEETNLKQYGWVDEKSGVVRLPIDRAKELLFQRGGLPSRPPAGEAQPADTRKLVTNGDALPSDSSGGTLPERVNK